MKSIISICAFIILFMSCSHKDNVKLKFLVKLDHVDKIAVATPYDYYELTLDEFDMASATIPIDEACFATVLCEGGGMEIFLTPDKSVDMEISSMEGKLDFKIKCDDGGINDYMLQDLNKEEAVKFADFYEEESVFIANLDSVLNSELTLAEKLDFPEDFKRLNIERIKYNNIAPIGMYPQYHSFVTRNEDYLPSQAFFDFVSKYTIEDASLYGLSSYVSFMDNIAVCSANRYIKDWDSYEFTTNSLSYIIENVKDVNLKEVLISKRVEAYLRSKGIVNSEYILKLANKYVKKPVFKNNIDTLVDKWQRLKKGNKSYAFNFKNIEGDTVNLDSFKGKYIMICIGATWCVHCQSELKELSKIVCENKDIQFVNVSIDDDFKNWTNTIKRMKYKFIQLNLSSDQEFLENYLVYSIPRFILLDKDGNILDAKLSLPSEGDFMKKIYKLL